MSKEISNDDLVVWLKGPTASIHFGKFGGPIYVYGPLKNDKKNITTSRGRAKKS